MKRREFLLHSGCLAGAIAASRVWGPAVLAAEVPGRTHIAWQRDSHSGLFVGVAADGTPLVTREQPGLLAGFCRLADEAPSGPPGSTHSSRTPPTVRCDWNCGTACASGLGPDEDLLAGTLTVINNSPNPNRGVWFCDGDQPPNRKPWCVVLRRRSSRGRSWRSSVRICRWRPPG